MRGLLWFSLSERAQATESYPDVLQQELEMPCVPSCTVCHRDANGGIGTVTTLFGQSMLDAQLTAKDDESVREALAELTSQ